MSEAAKITLLCSDGERFDVDLEVMKLSAIFDNMLKDLGPSIEPGEATNLPIESAIFRKVLDWCEQHKGDKPVTEDKPKETGSELKISDWDAEYLKIETKTLFNLILAANYLNIKGLQDICAKTIADLLLKGKRPEQIREEFGIVNDLTDEDMKEVEKERVWSDLEG